MIDTPAYKRSQPQSDEKPSWARTMRKLPGSEAPYRGNRDQRRLQLTMKSTFTRFFLREDGFEPLATLSAAGRKLRIYFRREEADGSKATPPHIRRLRQRRSRKLHGRYRIQLAKELRRREKADDAANR